MKTNTALLAALLAALATPALAEDVIGTDGDDVLFPPAVGGTYGGYRYVYPKGGNDVVILPEEPNGTLFRVYDDDEAATWPWDTTSDEIGDDVLRGGGQRSLSYNGGHGDDWAHAGTGRNQWSSATLDGKFGNDTLIAGSVSVVTLMGNQGNDILVEGSGWTRMYGGYGADTYVLNPDFVGPYHQDTHGLCRFDQIRYLTPADTIVVADWPGEINQLWFHMVTDLDCDGEMDDLAIQHAGGDIIAAVIDGAGITLQAEWCSYYGQEYDFYRNGVCLRME